MLIAFLIASLAVGLFIAVVANGDHAYAFVVRILSIMYVIWTVFILFHVLQALDLGPMRLI